MSTYRLDSLLAPKSVALIGASPRANSVGRSIIENLRAAGFPGAIHVVNPTHRVIEGITTVKDIGELSDAPDLAVITTPPAAVPHVVEAAASKGVKTAIVITAGLGHGAGSLSEQAVRSARSRGMRLLGPNCLGLISPLHRLNASFAGTMPRAGNLALISQSGGVAAGLVGWAASRNIGFSAIVSCGEQADVDVPDLLDHFALDRATRAILLYIESITDARKFMSAARAAARLKPVLVLKSGRHREGAAAAATHTGALAGSDEVYEAAFRRSGLVRVMDLSELFDAAATLEKVNVPRGDRLAIMTNGGGIGVLAIDRLVDFGGRPAKISSQTLDRLNGILPPTWSKSNPVDIIGDADADRHARTLQILLNDEDVDAVLILHVDTTLAPAAETAMAVCDATQAHRASRFPAKPALAVWVGADAATEAIFRDAGVPHYATEAEAVRGYMHMVGYERARRALMETPPALSATHYDRSAAQTAINAALAQGRRWLDPIETAQVLCAYQIPALPVRAATTPEDAASAASEFLKNAHAVAIKILSPDIVHKSDVAGVRLNITTAADAAQAAAAILRDGRKARPDARIDGVAVYPMVVRPNAREVFVGIADDPTFGPVIAFGRGGTAVEIINDKALDLPPLDLKSAHELIARTRVSRMLKAYRNVPAVRTDELAQVLVHISNLSADFAEIRELDLNPIVADETGLSILDARISVAAAAQRGAGNPRFAIRPYPKHWETPISTRSGLRALLRPVRPEDEPLFATFLRAISPDDLRLRFFAPIKDFGHEFIARLTQIDYDRAMVFLAIDETNGDMLGVAGLHADANHESAEYAILVRSDLKGHGLGWSMMEQLVKYARREKLRRIEGEVLKENSTMLQMCEELGFFVTDDRSDPAVRHVALQID